MGENDISLPTAIDNPTEVIADIDSIPQDVLHEFEEDSDESEE